MAKKKILVVDDEPDIVKMVKMRLEAADYEVSSAYDGQQALDKVYGENFDLIILDVMLPKMNGYQVSRLLKFNEEYRHIPIIMLTARSQESDKALGEETGADLYITKPFEFNEILEGIKKLS